MDSSLDVGDLRAFAATVRAGNLTRAAMALGVTQPAISQRIQRLERDIGDRLLERTGRGVSLTSAGDNLLGYAERIVALHDEAQQAFRPSTGTPTGPITIAILEDLAPVTLPGVLADFAAVHPAVELEVIVDDARALAERDAAGQLDLVVGDSTVMDAAAVRWRTTVPLVWTATAGFDLDQDPLPLVLFSLPCRWRRPILDTLVRDGRRWRIAFQGSTLGTVQAALSAGLGIAAMMPINLPAGCIQIDAGALAPPPAVDLVVARGARDENRSGLDTLESMLCRSLERNTTPAT